MKKFFLIFFVTLGVIFFALICVGGYLFVADPYNIRPLISSFSSPSTNSSTVQSDKHPLLNAEQESALQGIGIDPGKLPAQITPEQEACFIRILGEARVGEIKAGSAPTVAEFVKVGGCI